MKNIGNAYRQLLSRSVLPWGENTMRKTKHSISEETGIMLESKGGSITDIGRLHKGGSVL